MEGDPGVLDASQSLRVLAMLAELLISVAPEDAELPLADLHIDSAVASIAPTNVAEAELAERVHDAFERPTQLTRRLRSDLADAFRTRDQFGIEGFGYRQNGRDLAFDQKTFRRVDRSLARPTGWAAVTGEVRRLGKTRAGGVSGKIRSTVDGHVVNFEAGGALEDSLRESLFRRAVLSGTTEVDDEGIVKRVFVERVERLGKFTRLSDADFDDVEFDTQATLAALKGLRSG